MNPAGHHTPAPRVPLLMEINYRRSYARQNTKGVLRNISLTGAFLEATDHELKALDKLIITFVVGGRKRNISATVIWSNTRGCGIKFQPFNNRDVQIVDDLMYFVEASRENRRSVIDSIFKRVG